MNPIRAIASIKPELAGGLFHKVQPNHYQCMQLLWGLDHNSLKPVYTYLINKLIDVSVREKWKRARGDSRLWLDAYARLALYEALRPAKVKTHEQRANLFSLFVQTQLDSSPCAFINQSRQAEISGRRFMRSYQDRYEYAYSILVNASSCAVRQSWLNQRDEKLDVA